jgi:DNA invertase Pin-like site-specific DNA recombinase
MVGVNEAGRRVGEHHPNAGRLRDDDVDLMRELHESGVSYGALAIEFGVHKQVVAKICQYERRIERATRLVPVKAA